SAMVFPEGLMLVVVAGAELFNGKNLMAIAIMDKKKTVGKKVKNSGLSIFFKFSKFNFSSCTFVFFFYIDRGWRYKKYRCGRRER
ncbi:formate/nitrite transporter family protein, partial [Clostridioides difficile]|uniref:formate/nitrite transporter family protein n=1 Tax=Clostridioides difficile TaxID=1496 RepID=UPI001F45C735